MAKSYTPGASAKDRARLALADTAEGGMELHNEEIEDLIGLYGYVEGSAKCAEAIAAIFYRRVDSYAEADVKRTWRDRASGYLTLATRLRNAAPPGLPTGPGTAVGQMRTNALVGYRSD